MGKVAAALGQGATLVHGEKEYTLSPWTYSIQGQFERYLEEHVLQTFKRMAPYMTPEERKDEIKKVRQEIAAGEYTFGGEVVAKALTAIPHLKYLFYLMLKVNHPEVTLDLVGEMVDAQLEEVMAKMAQANADPSTPAVETETISILPPPG